MEMPWYVNVFLSLGGLALLWSAAAKGLPWIVDKAGDWLLSKDHPKIRAFVVNNADRIKDILKQAEAELEKDIDQAKAEDTSGPAKSA